MTPVSSEDLHCTYTGVVNVGRTNVATRRSYESSHQGQGNDDRGDGIKIRRFPGGPAGRDINEDTRGELV